MLTDEEVKVITGASPGSCGPIGLDIPIYMDKGVENLANFIVGANKDDFHLRNVNAGRDFKPTLVADLRLARAGDKNPEGDDLLREVRGIEVGHIFYLGTKYSKAMGASYLSEKGQDHPIEMGCYGIGITRSVQAAIEASHDKDGIIWPFSIAPFTVHLSVLDPDDTEVMALADRIYQGVYEAGFDAFMDDRQERPGPKFKDADLLGMPLRLNIGARGLKNDEIELVDRKSKEIQKVPVDKALPSVLEWLKLHSN